MIGGYKKNNYKAEPTQILEVDVNFKIVKIENKNCGMVFFDKNKIYKEDYKEFIKKLKTFK